MTVFPLLYKTWKRKRNKSKMKMHEFPETGHAFFIFSFLFLPLGMI